jgi:hypothetical protein
MKKTVLFSVLALAAFLIGCIVQPARAEFLSYVGVDYPWIGYGYGFGSSYNSATADSNLSTIRKTYHCNLVRIWCCEGLDGLSFNGSACTGMSQTNLNNISSFVSYANSLGITVDCVFINFMDVQNDPTMISNTTNANDLVWNGFIPLVKALNGKTVWFDLINEGNLSTNKVSWSNLRWFDNTAVNAAHNQGYNPWITMSDQNSSDYVNDFSSTVGGLGFSFYDYHAYGNSGSIAVSPSNVGGAPMIVGEYGPSNPWNDNSAATNNSCIDNIMNNASNLGYKGTVAWTFTPDGSNWQLSSNSAMWTIEYYGAAFGH